MKDASSPRSLPPYAAPAVPPSDPLSPPDVPPTATSRSRNAGLLGLLIAPGALLIMLTAGVGINAAFFLNDLPSPSLSSLGVLVSPLILVGVVAYLLLAHGLSTNRRWAYCIGAVGVVVGTLPGIVAAIVGVLSRPDTFAALATDFLFPSVLIWWHVFVMFGVLHDKRGMRRIGMGWMGACVVGAFAALVWYETDGFSRPLSSSAVLSLGGLAALIALVLFLRRRRP